MQSVFEGKHVVVYIYIYVYMYLSICIYIYICMYSWLHAWIDLYPGLSKIPPKKFKLQTSANFLVSEALVWNWVTLKKLLSSSLMVESAVQQSASDIWDCYTIYIYIYIIYLPVQHSDVRLHQRTWFCQAFSHTATTFARTSALLIEKRNRRIPCAPLIVKALRKVAPSWGLTITNLIPHARTSTLCFASSVWSAYSGEGRSWASSPEQGGSRGWEKFSLQLKKNLSCLFDLFASSACQWQQGHKCWNVDGMLNKHRTIISIVCWSF